MPTHPALPPPFPAPVRRTARDLPPYRYVPGVGAHPLKHPDGHLFGARAAREPTPSFDPARHWTVDSNYLRGLELLEQRYFWEAHEVLEGQWRLVDPVAYGPYRVHLQALIGCGAVGLHLHRRKLALAHGVIAKWSDRTAALGALAWGVPWVQWWAELRALPAGTVPLFQAATGPQTPDMPIS